MSNYNLLPEEAQNYSLPFSEVRTCKEKGLVNRIRAVWFYPALPLQLRNVINTLLDLQVLLEFFSMFMYANKMQHISYSSAHFVYDCLQRRNFQNCAADLG